MSKETLLTIEKFRDGEENKFLIKSPKEIQLTLHAIAQKKTVTILYFDDARYFLKSIFLAASEKGIWLDAGPDADDNHQLLNSKDTTLVTQHQGSKVQFSSQQIALTNYESHPAFFFPMPAQIMRLQRREYFRLPITTDAPLKCVMPAPAEQTIQSKEITILDISVGGIALTCREQYVKLEEGKTYENCQIELPEIGTLTATIQVKNLFEVTPPGGQPIKHAGCEFIKLDGNMSMLLQRYIGIMQSKLPKLR